MGKRREGEKGGRKEEGGGRREEGGGRREDRSRNVGNTRVG